MTRHASTPRLASTAALTTVLALAAASAQADPSDFRPGAPGVGDTYYPGYGNGGYDVSRYRIDLTYHPTDNHIEAQTIIDARGDAGPEPVQPRPRRPHGAKHRGRRPRRVLVPQRPGAQRDAPARAEGGPRVPDGGSVRRCAGRVRPAGYRRQDRLHGHRRRGHRGRPARGGRPPGSPPTTTRGTRRRTRSWWLCPTATKSWPTVSCSPVARTRAGRPSRGALPSRWRPTWPPSTSASGMCAPGRPPAACRSTTPSTRTWWPTPCSALPSTPRSSARARSSTSSPTTSARTRSTPWAAIVDDQATSCFALGDPDPAGVLRGTSCRTAATFVVAHELAHQWFGDASPWTAGRTSGSTRASPPMPSGSGRSSEGLPPPSGDRPVRLRPDPRRRPVLGRCGSATRASRTCSTSRCTSGARWRYRRCAPRWATRTSGGSSGRGPPAAAGGTGTTPQLVALAEQISGTDLGPLFDAWLYTGAKPAAAVAASGAARATFGTSTKSAHASSYARQWLAGLQQRAGRGR